MTFHRGFTKSFSVLNFGDKRANAAAQRYGFLFNRKLFAVFFSNKKPASLES